MLDDTLGDLRVAIFSNRDLDYPIEAPYSPHAKYPEYHLTHVSREQNGVYDAIRRVLHILGCDYERYGKPDWNPLGSIIKQGDTVLIKPNFVLDRHDTGGDLYSIITHPSVIRAMVDYAYIAINGNGRIIIADSPQMDCDFSALLEKTKLRTIQEIYQRELGFDIEIYDLRDFWFDSRSAADAVARHTRFRHKLPGDPQGDVRVTLGAKSLFYGMDSSRFYGADFDRNETIRFHNGKVQDYVISKTALSANVLILVPKMKVHKKVGVTLNIKGMVGTVTNKNCLVHYRLGTPEGGGDQFPEGVLSKQEMLASKLQRRAYDIFLARRSYIAELFFSWAKRAIMQFLDESGSG